MTQILQSTIITLPELKLQNIKIGGNRLTRFAVIQQQIEITISESDHDGWYQLETVTPPHYNNLHLRKPGKRQAIPTGVMCLEFVKPSEFRDLDKIKKLRWVQHPSMQNSLEPDEIVSSWTGCFKFLEDKPEINQSGLRPPQLGALHAISAYFSVKRDLEPATVVLPTGTGKTETMLSVLVSRQLPRLLILVPSNMLRNQISKKFHGLGYLSKLGLIPIDTALPSVVTIKTGIKSIEDATELLERANIFIATASVLDSSDQNSVDHLCSGITDLFIDEAHHITAATWTQVKDRFVKKRIVQFTATPFRNNGAVMGGRIIYNYTMGEAQEANYFRHINLIPVEKYNLGEGDRAIAESAIKQLNADLTSGYDHLLMARVEKKTRADEILPLYLEMAPELAPVIVHSGMTKSDIKGALSMLECRESRIVICVNMLGEGFDLPNLKVAAIHDIHKSLAITLQFIGRFTRQENDLGDASVIVNVAEPEVETRLQHLYAQGADWDSVLRHLSEKQIVREERLQEIVEQLKEKGNLHKQISLRNLRPSFTAVLFKTNCDTWNPESFYKALPENDKYWCSISEEKKLLVILAIHHAPLKWGKNKDLIDNAYKLIIVKWDTGRSALFIYASDYKWFRIDKLSSLLCNTQCEILSGARVFNVFNGLQYPLVRNLGASQVGAISFTQYFGSNVTEGLDRIESAKSILSNLAGLGYDNGERVIWGCSQKKGKVWSVNTGSIFDWSAWVTTAWDKVTTGNVDEANITRNFLRPKTIMEPYSEYACAVQWGEHIQADPENKVKILFGEIEIPLYLVDLKIIGRVTRFSYHIAVSYDETISVYEFTINKDLDGGFNYLLHEGRSISIKRGNGAIIPIEEYLQSDPWIIQYVDGSFSYNCFLIKLPHSIGMFDAGQIECWDWSNIDIKKESMGKERDASTIQWRSFENLENLYDVIINDDGSGEAADLVGLKATDDEIHLGLIHCKYSASEDPGARVIDLYELCGQAQKSIRWKHGGILRLYSHLKDREDRWKTTEDSRFLQGSISDLANIKRRARTTPIKFKVYIVQPGLKKDKISGDMLRVLGNTEAYLKNTAQAELIVIGSA